MCWWPAKTWISLTTATPSAARSSRSLPLRCARKRKPNSKPASASPRKRKRSSRAVKNGTCCTASITPRSCAAWASPRLRKNIAGNPRINGVGAVHAQTSAQYQCNPHAACERVINKKRRPESDRLFCSAYSVLPRSLRVVRIVRTALQRWAVIVRAARVGAGGTRAIGLILVRLLGFRAQGRLVRPRLHFLGEHDVAQAGLHGIKLRRGNDIFLLGRQNARDLFLRALDAFRRRRMRRKN